MFNNFLQIQNEDLSQMVQSALLALTHHRLGLHVTKSQIELNLPLFRPVASVFNIFQYIGVENQVPFAHFILYSAGEISYSANQQSLKFLESDCEFLLSKTVKHSIETSVTIKHLASPNFEIQHRIRNLRTNSTQRITIYMDRERVSLNSHRLEENTSMYLSDVDTKLANDDTQVLIRTRYSMADWYKRSNSGGLIIDRSVQGSGLAWASYPTRPNHGGIKNILKKYRTNPECEI